MKKIFITSGGTGGHIIPARCLASCLIKSASNQVFFFGDEKYRSYIKAQDEFKSQIIYSSQLRKSFFALTKAAFLIGLGVLQSSYFLLKLRPQYLVAFGGYSTFPMLIAAIITRSKVKIILHEQNAHFGKVNRLFAKYASKIALSFPETSGMEGAWKKKAVFTGNPVREEILQLHKIPYKPLDLKTTKPIKILIIGGSGGAKIFSEILPQAFAALDDDLKNRLDINQQCRKELVRDTMAQYRVAKINAGIAAFYDNMPKLIESSHLVIARSGSSSLFEFCAAKKPMILVPFAKAADNHQEKNAEYLRKNKAAIVIAEKDFTIEYVTKSLKNIISNETTLKDMSDNAAKLAVIKASDNLASLINA